jgi:hypothetical protein
MAHETSDRTFTADPKILEIAEAYALDAIDHARQFRVVLDWTEKSIAEVEEVLAAMHNAYISSTPKPPEDRVLVFAKAYGSYIGEVYRRFHGGEWGMVTLDGQTFPGMRGSSGAHFWPWGRALSRIKEGPEDNVYDYYKMLLEE